MTFTADGKDYLWFSILFLWLNKSHKNKKVSLTVHSKYKYFDSTVQRAEDRRQKFHFCRLPFAVNVMLNHWTPLPSVLRQSTISRFLEPPGETQIGSRNREFEKSKEASNYA